MNAWIGIIGGGVIGGAFGFALTKVALKHADVGVTVAATAAGALVGGALTAAKPADTTQANASTTS